MKTFMASFHDNAEVAMRSTFKRGKIDTLLLPKQDKRSYRIGADVVKLGVLCQQCVVSRVRYLSHALVVFVDFCPKCPCWFI